MARLIDADALEEFIADAYGYQAVDILGDIAKFPTVDAVEVVRCRDCKHFWESFSGSHSCKLHKGLVGTKFDTFCSYGEREDNA